MPQTSSLGDIQRNAVRPARDPESVSVMAVRDPAKRNHYEAILSIIACITLIGCGIGVGIWAGV